MVSVTINGAHESAHAMQKPIIKAQDALAPHDTPCTPFEHHQDYDGCDNCGNCACHASMVLQPFKLEYNPIIVNLSMYDPFKHLLEVYLTKFIPPQIQV